MSLSCELGEVGKVLYQNMVVISVHLHQVAREPYTFTKVISTDPIFKNSNVNSVIINPPGLTTCSGITNQSISKSSILVINVTIRQQEDNISQNI